MRYRENPLSKGHLSRTNYYDGSAPSTYGCYWTYGHEFIADDPKAKYHKHPLSGRRHGDYKECCHVRQHTVPGLQPTTVIVPGHYYENCLTPRDYLGVTNLYPEYGDPGAEMLGFLLAKCPSPYFGHYDRWMDKKPTMASRASLSVFLWELSDIKKMWDFIPSKHLAAKWSKTSELKKLSTWRETLDWINGGIHLNYNFGWKPFVRDVINVWDGVSTFEDRLKKFVSDADRDLVRHRNPEPVVVSDSSVETAIYSSAWRIRKSWELNYSLHSTFDFCYTLPPWSINELRLRAMADTLGLVVDPEVLWEVIPWSFVVDMMHDVGGYLQKFHVDWAEPWVNMHQACCSIDFTGTTKWELQRDLNDGWWTIGSAEVQKYERRVGLPNATIEPDTLDADKIRLLASLGLSLVL